MGNDSGTSPGIVAEAGSVKGLLGMYSSHDDRSHARLPAGAGKSRALRSAGARHVHAHVQAHWHDSLLQPDKFAEAVHRETRRSERTCTPLSIVRYTIEESAADDPSHFERLLEVLQASKRETDFLGHTGTDTLAVLCPDTDSAGAHGLIAKLRPLVCGLHVLPATATFPEHLFESLSGHTAGAGRYQLFVTPAPPLDKLGDYPLKRTLDIALALLALALLGPLMLVAGLLVKLTSRGPVIFKQPRLGKGGTPFTFYKFRSMVVNVDDRIHREYMANLIRSGHGEPASAGASTASYKMKADPRVTRIGKLIRMTSIDELPQLFNVIKGDMSMVGPRPPIPYEAAHYEPWHLRRILATKPGITGLWQVEGRSRVSFSEMVRMDLRYIRNCSLMLDFKILLRTVAVVLRCDGAR
jgi:lipopolysaccharide/colanic/teichoic acid biosynthesis glycosyltransferase